MLKPKAALLVLLLLANAQALAQPVAEAFPGRAVRMVVGFPPGGSSDVSARLVAERMSDEWKQPVIVENKPGAGGTIAAALVAAAPADGYTLLHVGPGTHAITSALYKDLSYDALKSFSGIGQIAISPFVIVVSASSNVKSMKELLDLARAKPGVVSYGSSGSGAGPNVVTEIVALSTGVKFLHVPYKGAAPAAAAALAGQVDFAMVDSASAIPHVQSGKLRALALMSAERSPAYPDVPTTREQGLADLEVETWYGMFAPAGTPSAAIQKVNGEINLLLKDSQVRSVLEKQGMTAAGGPPQRLEQLVARELPRWQRVVNAAGIKAD